MRLYYIDLPYACYGIVVDESDAVVDAAPIARWMLGKSFEGIIVPWLMRKAAKFQLIGIV